ncbi:MAG: hypothetical protein Q9209_001115 [Squamulea sp. 1 TL-2023]
MFSYLRSNNRRSALPTASKPYATPSRHVHSLQDSTDDILFHPAYPTSSQSNPSPISPDPPVLPPIPRVASQHESSKERDVEACIMFEAENSKDRYHVKQATQGFQSSKVEEPPTLKSFGDEQCPTNSRGAEMTLLPLPLQQNPRSQDRQLRPTQAVPNTIRSYSEPFSTHTEIRSQKQTNEGVQPARAPPPPPLRLSSGSGANGAQVRQGRTRLNLLNPMALLAKRRSHQAITDASTEKNQYKSTYSAVPGIRDDFDPRIRGNVVHDFSTPRPGMNESSNRARGLDKQRNAILYNSRKTSPNASASFVDDDSPSSGEREHTPQFKENFDEKFEPSKNGPVKQKTSAFMYQVSLSETLPDPDPSVLPPFARHLPSNISTAPSNVHQKIFPPPQKSLDIVPETSVTVTIPLDKSLPATPPLSPPVKARSRASSNTEPSNQPAELPKRFKSNASRFSFDLTGVGSAAQEKLLEDKHRQHERNKTRRSRDSQLSENEISSRDADDDDDHNGENPDDYDNVEADDGLEEKIPGVNVDEDESTMWGAYLYAQDTKIVSACKSSFTSDPSLTSTGITSPNTPRDSMGIPINLSTTQTSPGFVHPQASDELRPHPNTSLDSSGMNSGYPSHAHPMNVSGSGLYASASSSQGNDEDELYFDDGMIEGLDMPENHDFDESIFDDETSNIYGLPLRDRKPVLGETSVVSNWQKSWESPHNTQKDSNASVGDGHLADRSLLKPENSSAQADRGNRTSFEPSADVSNNAGFLDTLASGINQAAFNGKFNRWLSLGPEADSDFDDTTGSSEVYTHGGAREEAEAEGPFIGGGIEDIEDVAFDDALANDSIIAAANAEALENDDEGFYGQEFGFFARASGAGEAEYANGGYFGSREIEGIGRSHSGRNNDASLTPITERSEWSNRNSAISLAMHGFQQPQLAGPQSSAGLAQLADLIRLEDNDLSLSALMKLRRGAWGGSNASLQSSCSGSPLTHASGAGFPAAIPLQHSNSSNVNVNMPNGSPLTMYTGNIHASSSYSLVSSNGYASSSDDSQPSPASATISTSSVLQQASSNEQPSQSAPAFLPQQKPFFQQSVPTLFPPAALVSHQPHRRSMSPVKRSSLGPPPRPAKGHSRNSSAASESVSYVLETGAEDGGQGRWVLEKRRTDESGVVEVLGREIVEGGRI